MDNNKVPAVPLAELQLVCAFPQVQQDEEWDDWVRQAFISLDTNQDGVICEDDMRLTMNEEPEEVLTILRLLQSF